MDSLLKKLAASFFCLAAVIGFCFAANAYVLPGPHLLHLMVDNIGTPKSLSVTQQLVLYDSSLKNGIAKFNETVRYAFPEHFRSDTRSENIEKIHVVSKGETLTVIGGKVSDHGETEFDFFKDILLFRSRKMIQEKLSLHGVDVSVSSLGRFQGKAVFVLGALYPDESKSQVWFDKDTFRPFRWIIKGRDRDSLEIWYLGWRRLADVWYPMRTEFYQDNILVREIQVSDIKINPSLPDDIFDINHLRSVNTSSETIAPEKTDPGGLAEIQKTIDEFKKIFE